MIIIIIIITLFITLNKLLLYGINLLPTIYNMRDKSDKREMSENDVYAIDEAVMTQYSCYDVHL